MAARMVALFPFNTSPSNPAELNLNWSLRPVVMWTKFFGIPLFIKKPSGDIQSSWISFLPVCLTFYFLNLGSNAYKIMLAIDIMNQKSTTETWNYLIDEFNLICLSLTTHTTLLVISARSWIGLPDVLYRLEQYCPFTNNYKKLRRIFSIGSLIISMTVITEIVEMLVSLFSRQNGTKSEHLLRGLGMMVSFIIPILSAVLFCSLGWMASVMLRILNDELKSKAKNVATDQFNEWRSLFYRLNDRYLLIADLVHQINRLFGFILLALVTSEFVRMTSTSFYLLTKLYNNNFQVHVVFVTIDFIKEAVFFCILVYTPSRIRQEAGDLIKQLRQMNFENNTLEKQGLPVQLSVWLFKRMSDKVYCADFKINFLTSEMIHSLPNITAIGWFQVNLQLIPSLFGAALTYLIILCQFQTSETVNKP